jgi:hypothetical protein
MKANNNENYKIQTKKKGSERADKTGASADRLKFFF